MWVTANEKESLYANAAGRWDWLAAALLGNVLPYHRDEHKLGLKLLYRAGERDGRLLGWDAGWRWLYRYAADCG